MPRRKKRDPFQVQLTKKQSEELVEELVNHLDDAKAARSNLDEQAVYWMQLYEQARTRNPSNVPWPDAADLTSYLGTEKVDAVHSRIINTIFTEPIWTVEGWGEAQDRAAQVEEFHQWKAEEERLQSVIDRVLLLSLIDPIGILEVAENTETRMVQEKKRVALALSPEGSPMLNEEGQPILARDENGKMIPVEGEDQETGSVEVQVDEAQRVRVGPSYKVVPFRDFYFLPGHARDRDEVWGYAKRFYRRLPDIKKRAEAGFYDKTAVDSLSEQGERATDEMDIRSNITVMERSGDFADKELWEFLILKDLDGEGERWYLVTLHASQKLLLRVQIDDLNAKRYVTFTPIPRPDSVYGYSLIGDKLITAIEEHTAWRNMLADKAAMSLMAPIKRMVGAIWDPDEQPMGPKTVIDVRDMREVEPMQFPDITRGPIEREREVLQAGERIAGINDVALGTNPQADRTLGEVRLVTQQSMVRMSHMQKRVQESMEDLFQIRHAIWKRVLAEREANNEPGEQMPSSVLMGLENRGVTVPDDGRITAQVLEGAFRGKPRGSVETADVITQRQDFVQFVQMLPALLQMWPTLAQQLGTPQASRAILAEAVRLFRFENRAALLHGPDPQMQMLQQLLGGIPQPGIPQGGAPQQAPQQPQAQQSQGVDLGAGV